MKIRLIALILLCVLFTIGYLGCTADSSSETLSSPSTKSSISPNLQTGWYGIVNPEIEGAVQKQLDREKEIFYLDPEPLLTSEDIKDAYFYTGFNGKGVQMELTKKGVNRWAEATDKYTRKSIAFVFNNVLITVQRVAAQNLTGETIFYKKEYTEEELQAMIDEMVE